jgi:hypothetical protein
MSRGESMRFDSGTLQHFMKNRHVRVRNVGEMMTDKGITRRLQNAFYCVQLFTTSFKLNALGLNPCFRAKKPTTISFTYATATELRSTSLKTVRICWVRNVSLQYSLMGKWQLRSKCS